MKMTVPMTALCAVLSMPAMASDIMVGTELQGFQEVPSVSTGAGGRLRMRVNAQRDFIDYRLTYSGLQGQVQQAHIHFAQAAVNGPIVIWLCGTSALPGPEGTPTCPQSGSVTGHLTSANVLASPTTQQLPAGGLSQMVNAMLAGAAYANVHTTLSPGGEMRGQMGARDDE
jgi:CHRD domain